LILEVKGFDDREQIKRAAAERWASAVSAEGTYGLWRYETIRNPTEVKGILDRMAGPESVV
jgi:type III restriction enzyme